MNRQPTFIFAIVSFCISALAFTIISDAFYGLVLAMVGWVIWLWKVCDESPEPPLSSQLDNPFTHWHGLAIAIALLCFIALVEINTAHWNIAFLSGLSLPTQLIFFFVGVFGVVWGLGVGSYQKQWIPQIRHLSSQWEWQFVFLLTIIGFFLRAAGLDETSRFMVDELNTVSGVLALRDGEANNLLWQMSRNIMPYPWHYAYAHHLAVELFGRSLFGLRVVDAMFGAFSIPLLYLLAKALFDKKTAQVSALFVLTFPLHLHLSRLALINLSDGVLIVGIMAFFVRGFRHGSRMDFALAGLFWGLTQYFYEGGRLLITPLVIVSLLVGLLFWRDVLRRHWRGIVVMFIVALGISIPLYITWSLLEFPIAGRMTTVGSSGEYWLAVLLSEVDSGWLDTLYDQIARAFRVYVNLPDQSLFYGGELAMILPPLIPFFLVGIAVVLSRRRTQALLILLPIVGYSLSNGLFIFNPARYARYIGATPFVVLLIAIGVVRLFQSSKPSWLIWTVTILIVIGQGVYYFVPHLTHYNIQFREGRPYPDYEDAMLRSVDFVAGTQIHVIAPEGLNQNDAQTFLRLFVDDITVNTIYRGEFDETYLQDLPSNIEHVFYITPDDGRSRHILRQTYGDLAPQVSPYTNLPNSTTMEAYVIP